MNTGNALVLTGGGARGAYQAGVLKGISTFTGRENPFTVLHGTSAGAINCSFLAASLNDNDFFETSQKLAHMWTELQSGNIFNTNPLGMMLNGAQWVRLLAGGGFTGDSHNISLLKTGKLEKFLSKLIDFKKVHDAIESGKIQALGVNALCYRDSTTRTFFHARGDVQEWTRSRREGVATRIELSHVMASSAIPVLFPSQRIEDVYYGDGSVRDMSPLSPTIHLGGKKILIINVKAKRSPREISEKGPSLAQIMGTLLNGLMLDSLNSDLERIHATNELLSAHRDSESSHKTIETLKISPSQNISDIAEEEFENIPGSLQYFLKGLGNAREASEILSYVLFESNFTSRLVKLGYDDAMKRKDEILSFLN